MRQPLGMSSRLAGFAAGLQGLGGTGGGTLILAPGMRFSSGAQGRECAPGSSRRLCSSALGCSVRNSGRPRKKARPEGLSPWDRPFPCTWLLKSPTSRSLPERSGPLSEVCLERKGPAWHGPSSPRSETPSRPHFSPSG